MAIDSKQRVSSSQKSGRLGEQGLKGEEELLKNANQEQKPPSRSQLAEPEIIIQKDFEEAPDIKSPREDAAGDDQPEQAENERIIQSRASRKGSKSAAG